MLCGRWYLYVFFFLYKVHKMKAWKWGRSQAMMFTRLVGRSGNLTGRMVVSVHCNRKPYVTRNSDWTLLVIWSTARSKRKTVGPSHIDLLRNWLWAFCGVMNSSRNAMQAVFWRAAVVYGIQCGKVCSSMICKVVLPLYCSSTVPPIHQPSSLRGALFYWL